MVTGTATGTVTATAMVDIETAAVVAEDAANHSPSTCREAFHATSQNLEVLSYDRRRAFSLW